MDWNTIIFSFLTLIGLIGVIFVTIEVIMSYLTLKHGQAITLVPEEVHWVSHPKTSRKTPYIYFQSDQFLSWFNKKGMAMLGGFTTHRYTKRDRDQQGKYEVSQRSYDLLYHKFGKRIFIIEANPNTRDFFRSLLISLLGILGSALMLAFGLGYLFYWRK